MHMVKSNHRAALCTVFQRQYSKKLCRTLWYATSPRFSSLGLHPLQTLFHTTLWGFLKLASTTNICIRFRVQTAWLPNQYGARATLLFPQHQRCDIGFLVPLGWTNVCFLPHLNAMSGFDPKPCLNTKDNKLQCGERS